MKKFMLILFEDGAVYQDFSPEEMQKEIEIHMKWIEELGNHYVDGDPLKAEARTIAGNEKVVTDGPYIESKELVSGYYILKARDINQATELAKGCPVLRLGGTAEVREIMEY